MNFLRKFVIAFTLAFAVAALASDGAKPEQSATETTSAAQASGAAGPAEVNEKWMVEGQKRYLTNCGRCHQSPHEFSPREMAMAVRHMRVRAMLTHEDMNYLLYYMTHQ